MSERAPAITIEGAVVCLTLFPVDGPTLGKCVTPEFVFFYRPSRAFDHAVSEV